MLPSPPGSRLCLEAPAQQPPPPHPYSGVSGGPPLEPPPGQVYLQRLEQGGQPPHPFSAGPPPGRPPVVASLGGEPRDPFLARGQGGRGGGFAGNLFGTPQSPTPALTPGFGAPAPSGSPLGGELVHCTWSLPPGGPCFALFFFFSFSLLFFFFFFFFLFLFPLSALL